MQLNNILQYIRLSFYCLIVVIMASSCKYNTRHFMFKTEDSLLKSDSSLFENMMSNYVLRENDRFSMQVYSNDGEILIDPNRQMLSTLGGNGSNNAGGQLQRLNEDKVYLVSGEGETRLPMLGWIKTTDTTIFGLEQRLQREYSKFYVDTYVRIEVENRRFFYFGQQGGSVVPIDNENITLIEALALVNEGRRGSNMELVKIIRGDLSNPEVLNVDLSTINGMRQANLRVLPNDIIYVKPTRNAVRETIRDFTPIVQVISSTLSLIVALIAVTR